MTSRPTLLVAAALAAAAAIPAGPGGADTSLGFLDVNSFEDRADFDLDDGICDADPAPGTPLVTLRAAIQNANRAGQLVTINLDPGTYRLTLKGAGEDAAATGDLDITGNVRVLGAAAATVIIDAKKAKDRAFDVRFGATGSLANLTIRNGRTAKGDSGGGVRNDGTLTMDSCVVSKCKAADDAGAIDSNGVQATIQHCVILGCKAGDDGGGIDTDDSSVSVLACAFVKNKAKGEGGAVENSGGTVSLQACTISGNKSKSAGGGVVNEDGGFLALDTCTVALNKAKSGAGVSNQNSTVTLVDNVFWKNGKANFEGGGLTLGGNVCSDATCPAGANDLPSTDALLARLADNGGITLTHALLAGSPAATSGVNCGQGIDGRGVQRGTPCSSGAFQP